MGQIFDSYLTFWIFERFPAIWFDSKFEKSQLYKRILSFMSSATKSVLGDHLTFWLNYEKDYIYNRQTTAHISYMYTYTH